MRLEFIMLIADTKKQNLGDTAWFEAVRKVVDARRKISNLTQSFAMFVC